MILGLVPGLPSHALPGLVSEIGAGGAADSAAWIPVPSEDLDAADRLEDRGALRGAGVRADWRDGDLRARRGWIRAAPRFLGRNGAAEVAWLARSDSRSWSTARVEGGSRFQAAAGAVVARRPPVLLGEALGLTRALRAPQAPRLEAPAIEAPRGVSSLAIRGAAARATAGSATAWTLAGRDAENAALVAGGLAVERRLWSVAAAGGTGRGLRAASLGARMGGEGTLAGEVLLSPSRGPRLLLEASRRSGRVRAAARWRRRSGEARPAAGELVLDAGSARARTRLTWSAWSVRAPSDDGRLEVEAALGRMISGPARARVGGRPGGERYVIADIEVARERGRSFTLLASRREKRRAGIVSAGSAWGGRLDWSARGRAGATLSLVSTRADGGSDAAAWAPALAPSGEETLVARGRAGVVVTGRAWLRAGPLEVEALLSDAGGDRTDRPVQGSLRVEWSRESR